MQCRFRACIADYLRGKLKDDDLPPLERHIADCPGCLDELAAQAPRLALAPRVPDCVPVCEIGRGRFGIVYKAWWLQGRPRIVALKILNAVGEMERSRFEREIAVLTKLDTPHIVKCLASGGHDESMFFIMEYVRGVPLDEFLKNPSHDLPKRLHTFADICAGVADAHDAGVIHRDLKPRNIIVEPSGCPHILDFGVCSVDHTDWSSWARCDITHPGDLIGTLRYMSPEQAWGGLAGPIDERSDIWALGIMLFEIVTDGAYPYPLEIVPGSAPHEALLEHIRKSLPRQPRLRHLPRGKDLELLVERCLSWEPPHRLSAARDLRDDLLRYLERKHLRTRPLRWHQRVRRLAVGAATRSRWSFAAAFVAAVGSILFTATIVPGVRWRSSAVAPTKMGGTAAAAGRDPRDNIVIVAVDDDTAAQVIDFAGREEIAGVTGDIKTWRAVHGRLLQRLAIARPLVVLFDYYFRTPQPGDDALVEGIRRLEEAGTPVVLAARTYDDAGRADLSPRITNGLGNRLRHGAIAARNMVERPGEFVMAIKRPDATIIPSTALATCAALQHSETALEVEWPSRGDPLTMLYRLGPGSFRRERRVIELTTAYESPRSNGAVRHGDLLACVAVELDRPEVWAGRTVSYHRLLLANDRELANRVRGKVLVVGDMRRPRLLFRGDWHPVRYGVEVVPHVPGCYLLADAVAGLSSYECLIAPVPLPAVTLFALLAVATVGWLTAIRLAVIPPVEWLPRSLVWSVIGAGCVISYGVTIASREATTVHAAMFSFALLLPLGGSLWVEFTRNRHRMADRKRRAVESLGLSGAGQLNRPLPQPTSSPGPG